MELTQEQKATLKAAIQADPVANVMYVDGNLRGLAEYYNEPASPAFVVWRVRVLLADVVAGILFENVANLTTANNTRLQTWFMGRQASGVDYLNPSLENQDACGAFFESVFSVAAGAGTRARVGVAATIWRMDASRFERLYATGTGTSGTPGYVGQATTSNPLVGPVDFTLFQGL